MAKALAGPRKARDKISSDPRLSGQIRAEVLCESDEQTERLADNG